MINRNDMCIPEPEDEEFKEIENLYYDFCSSERLKRIHPFIKDFKEIFGKYCKDTIIKLAPSKNVYRARIIDKEDIKKGVIGRTKLFKGYDEENSFVPPEIKCNAGRLNYKNQVFLYTAQEELTAIMEVRPQLNQKVSLAKIELKKELELLNLTHFYNLKTANYKREAFVDIISEALYTPINDDEKEKYINTQIIADVVKEMGYDGIAHISSINHGGMNYCIFNYEHCKATSSEIYIPIGIKMCCQKDGCFEWVCSEECTQKSFNEKKKKNIIMPEIHQPMNNHTIRYVFQNLLIEGKNIH